MGDNISFFLPTRKGSERVINKNTKPFAGVSGGILEVKLKQLLSTKLIDEIVLSTNDELTLQIAERYLKLDSRLKVIVRPDDLCQSSTKLVDLISYVPSVVSGNHVIWGHVTTPLADEDVYDEGVRAYKNGLTAGYDSLISVLPFQNFLLNSKGEVINKDSQNIRWPRTQDLLPLYEINHVMFIASKHIYQNQFDRVGQMPLLFEMGKVQSLDVDWEDDFLIAEAVYEKTNRS
jgi:CMP-N-acetylneuraminic acid synthetase